MFRWAYHVSRVILGGWFVYSGVMPLVDPSWQPYGQTEAAIQFTTAMVDSHLMTVVKVVEIVTGVLLLLNRAMPLVVIALVPVQFVIVWWNFVLDGGTVEYTFGALTIVFTAVIAWAWRRHFWPLFRWHPAPDYTLKPGWETGH